MCVVCACVRACMVDMGLGPVVASLAGVCNCMCDRVQYVCMGVHVCGCEEGRRRQVRGL